MIKKLIFKKFIIILKEKLKWKQIFSILCIIKDKNINKYDKIILKIFKYINSMLIEYSWGFLFPYKKC